MSAAGELGAELVLVEGRTDADITDLLETMPDAIDAVFLVPDSMVNARLSDILERTTQLSLPTSGPSTAQVEQGAVDDLRLHPRASRRPGGPHRRSSCLRGADPGDLPVEDAESFLGVNLVTADLIGLEVTDATLQQAAIIVRPTSAEDDGE